MKKKGFLICCLIIYIHAIHAQDVGCQPFAMTQVRLLPSRFHDNFKRDSAWMMSIPTASLLHSFRTNAGVFSGKEGGYFVMKKLGGWESLDCDLRGHTTGHLLSALAILYAQTGQNAVKVKADSLVNGLFEVQQALGTSGYLSAYAEGLIDRNIQGKSVWAPWYTLHKILQGLIDQYSFCQNETALVVATRMGDWAYNKLKPLPEATRTRMIRNEFGGFNEAMYNLYAITGDERHLWVARFFYHNEKIDPLREGKDSLGNCHANTLIPKVLGECRNYELFGDADSKRAAVTLFQTLVRHHAFVTGEVSDKEHLFRPEEQSRHLTGYDGENCCTYNLLKLAHHLFQWEPNSRIADYQERALYNHILGQQDPASSMVCYFTPMQTGAHRLYSTRYDSFWCCIGSGFENHVKYASSIYYHCGDTLYVNLFIPSEVHWNDHLVRQETRFPESNRIRLVVKGQPRKGAMKIRHPYWATYMKMNGKKVRPESDGYVNVNVSSGPIEVEFGMQLHEESTIDDSTRVALMYGPVVLAGRLSEVASPFSDPSLLNDYYTYDYGQHPDVDYHSLQDFEHVDGTYFVGKDGMKIEPFYNLHHSRYVVYWKKK